MLIYNIIQYKILSTVSFENEKLIDNSSQKTELILKFFIIRKMKPN